MPSYHTLLALVHPLGSKDLPAVLAEMTIVYLQREYFIG